MTAADQEARSQGIPAHDPGAPAFYAADASEISIDQAIAGLADKMSRLDEVIAALEGNGDTLIRLFRLYMQVSSRLARLLRGRRARSRQAADGFAGAIAQALEELGTELGIDLT